MPTREELISQAKRKHLILQARQKYETTISAAPSDRIREPEPKILEEQHPAISGWDRFKLLNFSQGPEASLKYLQQENPNLSIGMHEGRIVAKDPGETDYRVIDPQTGIFSTDIIKDIGDVVVDVGRGVVGGAAQIAGAIGGGTAGGPAGAIAGGATAGGAADAFTEYLRQKTGESLGIPQTPSGKDIAMEGAFGAGASLLFGAGKYAKGAIPAVYKKITRDAIPKAAELTTGVKAKDVRNYFKFDKEIKELTENGISKFSDDLGKEVDTAYTGMVNNVTDKLDDLVKKSDTVFDVTPIKKIYADEINLLNQKRITEGLTGTEEKHLSKLTKEYADTFQKTLDTGEVIGTPNVASGEDIYKLKKVLQEKASFFKKNEKLGDKAISNKAKDAIGALNQSIDNTVPGAKAIREEMTEVMSKKPLIENFFITRNKATGQKEFASKTHKTLTALDRQNNAPLAELLTEFDSNQGTNIIKKMEILKAHQALGSNNMLPKSLGGSTSTSRSLTNAAGLGTIGWYAGANIEGLGSGGGRVGAGIGAATGLMLLNPTMFKNYIKAGLKVEKGARGVYDLLPSRISTGTRARIGFNLLENRGE